MCATQAVAQHTRWCWLTHTAGGVPTLHWSWGAPNESAWVQLGRRGKAMHVEYALAVELPSLRMDQTLGGGIEGTPKRALFPSLRPSESVKL